MPISRKDANNDPQPRRSFHYLKLECEFDDGLSQVKVSRPIPMKFVRGMPRAQRTNCGEFRERSARGVSRQQMPSESALSGQQIADDPLHLDVIRGHMVRAGLLEPCGMAFANMSRREQADHR